MKLMHGDCLERMKEIESGSVDMVLTDPPYGTTACKWDSIIPPEPMWEQLKRVIKPNGAIVMTASQPFTTTLIASNMKMFKYCWVWRRSKVTGFLNANYRPLLCCEDIAVFSHGQAGAGGKSSSKNMPYFPQGVVEVNKTKKNRPNKRGSHIHAGNNVGKDNCLNSSTEYVTKYKNYPQTVLDFPSENGLHPTQKPVALMEYLIKTYTNEGETVLDFTMGSGTTGVACANLNRKFIGIEMDEGYFNIALARIEEAITANKRI